MYCLVSLNKKVISEFIKPIFILKFKIHLTENLIRERSMQNLLSRPIQTIIFLHKITVKHYPIITQRRFIAFCSQSNMSMGTKLKPVCIRLIMDFLIYLGIAKFLDQKKNRIFFFEISNSIFRKKIFLLIS